ncbi:unnamed protein product [Dracunculus medinensis]|uniref:HCO3_cotransp domain-containing protein n=1 Tax=Dracunculus medinensis TaxID=318479 RepID=A0A158Q5V2_DRAME|nr:unnamed protein product [Dracunculus medinensis]
MIESIFAQISSVLIMLSSSLVNFVTEPYDGWRQEPGGLINTWTSTIRKDFERIRGPAIYGLRRWKKEWLLLLSTIASDCVAWELILILAPALLYLDYSIRYPVDTLFSPSSNPALGNMGDYVWLNQLVQVEWAFTGNKSVIKRQKTG